MRVEPAFRKWATHASLCSSAHGHVENHSHYGGRRRSGSYRTRNCVSSRMCTVTSRWCMKAPVFATAIPRGDQSATIYFLRGDACRPFLFLSGAASWNDIVVSCIRRCDTAPAAKAIRLSGISKSAESGTALWMCDLPARSTLPTSHSCAWHARALLCLICIAKQKDWIAGAWQMFDSFLTFWSAHLIMHVFIIIIRISMQ